jgi:virulence-associated protein VapD
MFAIAYDIDVVLLQEHHPKSSRHGYADIAALLQRHGFARVQGSVFVSDHEDLSKLFLAISGLQALSWLKPSVKNLRAFRVDRGADFTTIIRGTS